MNDVSEILTELAELEIPAIATDVFPDLMGIIGETKVKGPGGGQIKTAVPIDYLNVPVMYEPMQSESRRSIGEKLVSFQQYRLTFPVFQAGARINIDPKRHRLVVLARGAELAKTFRITAIRENYGVYYEAVCEKEN